MAPTLALQFLSLFLLFIMNGYVIGARDMKVELRDQKQVEWYKATSVSNDESNGKGYITTSESAEPNYIASYTAAKHNQNHEKLHQPYIAGYTSDAANKANQYIAGYRTKTHDSNTPYIAGYTTTSASHKANQPNYLAGYRTKTDDSNTPYIAGYTTTNAHVANNQPNYIAGYRTSTTQESNTPSYIAGYRTSTTQESNTPSYIAGYRTSTTQESNTPYIAGYRTSTTQESNTPYIAGYRTSTTQESNTPYIAGYRTRTTHDPNAPYIAGYTTTSAKKAPKGSSHDDTTGPYITQYGGPGPKNDPKESSNLDHTEAFKTGFFALDDLYVGNVMTLQFPIQDVSQFLPRKEAESIPFSISQLPSVLQLFSISEDSPEANAMRDTLEQCEAEPITGETKICATSLESMLEFIGTIIGSETKHNILTTTLPTASGVPLQKFTILEVSEDINAAKWVACHPLPYPYAIYYCHFIATGSKVFKVSLGSENGDDKIEALGICHLDTSDWSPNHIIFRQLGIKPGKDAVCHFFPIKHLMWVPKPLQATM
ncbi:hypothetical protein JHK82_032799 [Glycine max]|uniref:BURP domain-containing protein n=1 Tax=Glycine max TaxID=3847 RepID=I1LQ51_SOYBN|nr:ice nucleation protein InaA isoform X1 [Glycine max]KAG5118379.1 hypothetical protein JHK82_032799 [Glycine max]KAG5139361.1 hypothetical protein JHK84_033129 [Glycine max]KRH24492.1 hypothetical protein GLYMA_12G044600v4 [Glycine max]|eukprot:XP_006592107.1 uncharacterized protein LOC100787424 isoform X1 [Glycine max]